MAEQENKNVAEEQNEQNENKNKGKENKEMSEENNKNEEKGKVKSEEKKKEGFFKRTAKKFKKNRREIFSALGGLAIGIGGTLGIEKLGEHFANKKNMTNAQDETVYYENNDDGTYNDN